MDYQFKPMKVLTFVALALMVLRLISLVGITYFWASQSYFDERIDFDASDMSDPFVAFGALSSLFYIVFWVLSGAVSLWWIYGAARNTLAIKPEVEITPGWAVGWFFVPIMNLFKPLEFMSVMWTTSQARERDEKATWLMLTWWLCQLFGGILTTVASKMEDFQKSSLGTADLGLGAFGFALVFVATAAFAIIVLRIHQGQTKLHTVTDAASAF